MSLTRVLGLIQRLHGAIISTADEGRLPMEFILIAICIGTIPGFIAQSKGRSFVVWWLYGAVLFIVALPHSLLMKPDVERMEREQLRSGSSKKCPFCAELIKAEARVCRFCGRDLPVEVPPERPLVAKPPEKIIDQEELDRRFKEWQSKRG